MNIEQDLLNLKKKIDDNKRAMAQAEGKLEGYMARLEKEFGFSTVEEADAALTKLQKEIDRDGAKITKKIEELEERI